MTQLPTHLVPRAAFLDLPVISSSGTGVVASDRDGLGTATVLVKRGRSVAFAAAVKERFGIALLPGSKCSFARDVTFVATGPDSWLATREDAVNNLAGSLTDALGDCAAISDQSDGYAVLRLSGSHVRQALCKLVPIDLHPRTFAVGDVYATVAAHISVTLWRLQDEPNGHAVFEIAVYRSLAESFWTALSESAAEFGFKSSASRGYPIRTDSSTSSPNGKDI